MSLLYSRIAASRRDADATAYISAIRTAGATVTAAQRDYINDFIRAEKIANRWDSIKRFYLPIWGVAAANAICLRSPTSGTFFGTVTHAAGYVQGDGSTGYFAFSSTPFADSITATSNFQFMLVKTAETGVALATQGTSTLFRFRRSTANLRINTITGGGDICNANVSRIDQVGIFAGSRIAADNHAQYQRITSGFNTLATDVVTNTTAAVPAVAYTAMTMGGVSGFSNAEQGAYGYGLGLSSAETAAFTLALKNLWEGTTGLTLP